MVEDIEAIVARMKEAAERATQGSWSRKRPGRTNSDMGIVNEFAGGVVVATTPGRQMIYADPPGGSFPFNDAEHIAASNPANVLALCDAYEAVKKERDQARRYLGYSEGQTLEEAGLADNRRDRIRGLTALLEKAAKRLKDTGCDCKGQCSSVGVPIKMCAHYRAAQCAAEIKVALAPGKSAVETGPGASRESTDQQGSAVLDRLPHQGEPV